jgi:multicomponent K+:H+ antiporter subunit E
MNRWLPSPLLSLFLLLIWLLLNQSLELGQLLFGMVLAIVMPLVTAPLRPFKASLKKPLLLIRLLSWAMWEIIRSCFNVSRIILFNSKGIKSEFIRVPLTLKDPAGLAMLSCLINCTPGTVWVEVDDKTQELVLHVFDLQDPEWWIQTIKTRYEQPLLDIFNQKETNP